MELREMKLCECGCGRPTQPAKYTGRGRIKGQPTRFIKGHKIVYSHGQAKHGKESPTWRAWQGMNRRAENRSGDHPSYRYVRVCPHWKSFENFLADVGPRPTPQHSLGRILDRGNYEPENAFWMTPEQQSLAKKNNHALLKWARIKLEFRQGQVNTELSKKILHIRWHVNRDITKEECSFCPAQQAA